MPSFYPSEPSRKNSEPWVLVNMGSSVTGKHSRQRKPQLKASNMPSGQVARAVASNTADPSSSMEHLSHQLIAVSFEDEDYVLGQRAVSDDSTQTLESLHQAGLAVYDYPTAPHPLTVDYLQQHDRQQAEATYWNVQAWTEGSQPLRRMAAPQRESKDGGRRRRSRAYSNRAVERQRPSTISSGMADWGMVNDPAQASDDIAGSGTRFDDIPMGVAVYASQFLMIDEEELGEWSEGAVRY